MTWEQEMLGEYAEKGYTLQPYPDALEIRYKDKGVAAYPIGTSKIFIQEGCRNHEARMAASVGATQ